MKSMFPITAAVATLVVTFIAMPAAAMPGCGAKGPGYAMPGGYGMPGYGWQRPMPPRYGFYGPMQRAPYAMPPARMTSPSVAGGAAATTVAAADSATKAAESPAESATVAIRQMQFQPARVTVRKGATVTWEQQSGMPHNVTASNGSFASANLNNGGSFTQSFDEPGTYGYYCGLHPSMRGEVVVVE